MKACDVLHTVKVVPKVWYLVGIDLIEAPTTSQNGNRFQCHEDYGFNTAKRSFTHVCLLIALFSILVFDYLESDDRSCRRLRHCLLVNSSIK